MPLLLLSRGSVIAWALLGFTASVNGQERSFPSLLPDTTALYLQVSPAAEWLDHPLRAKIQASESFLKVWRSPDVLKLRGGLTLAETALGDSLENIARQLTHGGLAVALDREHQAGLLLARTRDAEWLRTYLQRVIKFARDDAAGKGDPDPVSQSDYRGLTIYQVDQALVTTLDELLLITNNEALGKVVVDRYLDDSAAPGANALSEKAAFQSQWRTHQENSAGAAGQEIAWAYVDVDMLREAGVAEELLQGKPQDFGAELILGGVLATLENTPSIVGSLRMTDQSVELSFLAPRSAAWGGPERDFFFGADDQGQAPRSLHPAHTLASLSAYRDLSQLWLRAGDLFNEQVNAQLAQADSTLTTLFSGRDFGEDILGALEPELRLVIARQLFEEDQPTPAIRLPSFALVAQLREPQLMRAELTRIFQSLVGFLNIIGAMEGQPQLDLGMETRGDQQFVTATYVREVDRPAGPGAPLQFNFNPTLAFVDESVILSSTGSLAQELAELVQHPAAAEADSAEAPIGLNTLLEVDASALYETLRENQDQLVAQNMLEEGHSQQEAENEIALLLSIMTLFETARLELGFAEQARLRTTLHFAD